MKKLKKLIVTLSALCLMFLIVLVACITLLVHGFSTTTITKTTQCYNDGTHCVTTTTRK